MPEVLHECVAGRLVDINGRLYFRSEGRVQRIESMDELLQIEVQGNLGLSDEQIEDMETSYFNVEDDEE